jgi:hypothetical protein
LPSRRPGTAGFLSVNPHVLATPVPIPPGVSEAVIPATFRATSGLPTAAQGTSFRKNITLRFRTLNGG